jgi:hypothetical protein
MLRLMAIDVGVDPGMVAAIGGNAGSVEWLGGGNAEGRALNSRIPPARRAGRPIRGVRRITRSSAADDKDEEEAEDEDPPQPL